MPLPTRIPASKPSVLYQRAKAASVFLAQRSQAPLTLGQTTERTKRLAPQFFTSSSSTRSSSLPTSHKQTAKMSTMPATHGHSEACCNTPPVVSEGYKPKGTYETLGGKKTYVTGPDSATKAIVEVFDIFGYKDQTVQGADILGSGGYRVFVPDWFDGEPCPLEYFPPNTPEKQAKLGAFFQKNPPGGVAAALPSFVKALKEKFPAIASYGVIGFCWGGKVVSLVTSGAENPFVVGAEAHPAMVEPKDALGIKVPLILLASKDEPPADVAKFEANLSAPKHVETFGDQIHGWMGARANLADEHVKAEYARGYKTVLEFFAKHL